MLHFVKKLSIAQLSVNRKEGNHGLGAFHCLNFFFFFFQPTFSITQLRNRKKLNHDLLIRNRYLNIPGKSLISESKNKTLSYIVQHLIKNINVKFHEILTKTGKNTSPRYSKEFIHEDSSHVVQSCREIASDGRTDCQTDKAATICKLVVEHSVITVPFKECFCTFICSYEPGISATQFSK